MNWFGSKLIPRYVLRAALPYFALTWILLSVIMFVQQSARYADIFFNANLPTGLIWQLSLALVPSVAAFTCPMAVLIGVIIGLAKMQGDSELIALRSAGVGNSQILVPVALLGIVLSGFALLINWKGVPLAAQIARRVGLEAALLKLESPVEPGVFNKEIWGYTVYVESGNQSSGAWENIFIFNEDKPAGVMRLITSKSGRIDTNQEDSELVLEEAFVTTLQTNETAQKPNVYERVKNLRFVVQTRRGQIIERLSKAEETPDELGLNELAAYARNRQGKERTEAEILWQRRIVLSVTPLLFALLGASLILRFSRGGRGFGIFLALLILIGYYLLALLGEQMARSGRLGVLTGSLLPVAATLVLIVWFNLSQRFIGGGQLAFWSRLKESWTEKFARAKSFRANGRRSFPNLATGILDYDIVFSLLKYFALSVGFLTATYLIFTAFELWKFAAVAPDGFSVLARYLLYLLPFIYIQIAPACLMIAALATFVIKSRQNEVVTWTAAGRSVYRLLLPCFLLMMAAGLFNWQIQERIAPQTNRAQDALRTHLRSAASAGSASDASGGGGGGNKETKYWTAADKRIYSYALDEKQTEGETVRDLYVFDFAPTGERLKSLIRAEEAVWKNGGIELRGAARQIVWTDNERAQERFLTEDFNPFRQIYTKPNHLNAAETAEKLEVARSAQEKRVYAIALEKKYATIALPFVITLFTAPFALSLSRKGKVVTIGYAVAAWLLFTGFSNGFEQLGLSGYLAPAAAVWSPLILFTIVGCFLISRLKT
jgi:lipopolysaccharide export LptBFGC system permease protein LptF